MAWCADNCHVLSDDTIFIATLSPCLLGIVVAGQRRDRQLLTGRGHSLVYNAAVCKRLFIHSYFR